MKKKFMVELMHEDDPSGCSNIYVVTWAPNEFIARKIIERAYRDRPEYYVTTAWEHNQ